MLGFIVRSQLYADSHDRVPMKILDTLPEKIEFFEPFFAGLKSLSGDLAGRVFDSFRR
jgi:hypothetical protein